MTPQVQETAVIFEADTKIRSSTSSPDSEPLRSARFVYRKNSILFSRVQKEDFKKNIDLLHLKDIKIDHSHGALRNTIRPRQFS